MKNIIQFSVEKGQDGYYTASASDFAIITQAKNLEDLIKISAKQQNFILRKP